MIFIDSNVFLYAANRQSPQHAVARTSLEAVLGGQPWAFSWNLVYEFLRAATHPRVFPKPLDFDEAFSFILEFIQLPLRSMIQETTEHAATVVSCGKRIHRISGNLIHDFHTAVLMKEHGVREILPFDRDFQVFPWIVLRPLMAGNQS